ncbi:HAD superfamily, subfamily IIIB (Acid phosphatase) [Streptomyces sp. ADI96-02]|uniref:HAD family acid phosphatase n=1 Tax=Streptomyces sp. ADI96-02 TaxID=1522760 RepID=UPI000F54FDF6|nr:HAD family acid phosphatase [Streptomyces sp. ADI96-02]RPK54554.1 HAD superfamily, subfamily IIIB (Acid phosphatase) [Streptomyces sp. ADI96-02]
MHANSRTPRAVAALAATLALVAIPATTATAAETAPAAATTVGDTSSAAAVDYETWRKDVAAVAAEARPWIEARSGNAGSEKQAIVLDVDNTALETHFHPFWEPTPAVADIRDLARYADSRGVDVFFVTARPGFVGPLTDRNLKDTGYPVDGLYVTELLDLLDVKAYKTKKRAEIEAKGYKIIANIGNSSSDLVGGHAERTFKLPDYDGQMV